VSGSAVDGFSAEWLALREPFDAAARSAEIVASLRTHLPAGTGAAPLAVVDLGAGAGSNLRYLAPLLGGVQHWRLVDHDEALLEAARATTREWAERRGARVEQHTATLAIRDNDFACEIAVEPYDLRNLDMLALPAGALVTAAALLDLVSASWLEKLARRCEAACASVCFALTYDGRTVCTPTEADDATVLGAFNRHQLGDKGFGPALGPGAARAAEAALTRVGYEVATAPSDWLIDTGAHEMQRALLDGWRDVAIELHADTQAELDAWHARRRQHVDAGHSTLRVGHVDVVGWL
jgi:hypothetical protein